MRKRPGAALLLVAALAIPASAAAQPAATGPNGGTAGAATGSGSAADTAVGPNDAAAFLNGGTQQQQVIAPPAADVDRSLTEDRDTAYFELGVRTHLIIIPDWLVKAFGKLDMGPGILAWALGPEFTYRKNGFDIVTSIWWGSYHASGFTRQSGHDVTDTEHIDSTLGAIWFTVEFLSGTDFFPWFGLTYGGGIGVGIMTGDVTRNEAYQDAHGWHTCTREGVPDAIYCEAGGHYNYKVPYNDGFASLWSAYPYLTGEFGFRWKPLRNLVIDGPELRVGLPELFSLGLRVNYMF